MYLDTYQQLAVSQDTRNGYTPRVSRWGDRIREIREAKGITQARLAELVVEHGGAMDRSRVSNIETGENDNPELDTLCVIAVALSVDIGELFTAPRPEQDAGHATGRLGVGGESPGFFEGLRTLLDRETPAPDTVEGDILKAAAALDRALRRLATARASGE